MSTTKPDTETGWAKEDPKVNGVYWWRADANDPEPDIHAVVNGRFYEAGMAGSTLVENFGGEWLGPISPDDLEQLIRLRDVARTSVDAIEFALTTPGLVRGRDLLKVNAAALREALAPKEKSRE